MVGRGVVGSGLVALVLLMPIVVALPPVVPSLADVVPEAAAAGAWLDPLVAQLPWDGFERLVVGVEPGMAQSIALAWTLQGIPSMAFRHVPAVVALAQEADLPGMAATPGVRSIVPDHAVELLESASVEGNFAGTGDHAVRSDRARALGYDGSGVGIAVIDSGVDAAHPGLLPRLVGGPTAQNVHVIVSAHPIGPYTPELPTSLYLENQVTTDLVTGHGSHVAGIALGQWTDDGAIGGRAPGAHLVAVGAGEATLVISWIISAFDYIIEKQEQYNIRVVSNSYGNPGPYAPDHPVNLATQAADDAGILVVFAAGNAGPSEGTLSGYAQAPYVLAVGATTLSGHVPPFSSRGDPGGQKTAVDLVAPGVNVIAPRAPPVSVADASRRTLFYDEPLTGTAHVALYRTLSGTSMAAPQVAGVAALLFEADPDLSTAHVREILRDTARPVIGAPTSAQGAGLVDAEAALRALLGLAGEQPDWVEPQEVRVEGDAFVYPFRGGMLGLGASSAADRHEFPFPVRSPSLGIDVTLEWEPVALDALEGAVDGMRLSLFRPDGSLVRSVAVDARTATIHVPAAEIAGTEPPGWTAGHWTLLLEAESGAMTYTVEPAVRYVDGVLPPVERVPELPPPPPPPLTAHDPILIPDDASFTAENGVVAGSGTLEDPYVISGWRIGETSGSAIHIGSLTGTTAHVVVRDVHLHDSERCVRLENAANVRVESSLFTGCAWATSAMGGSAQVTVKDNVFLNNGRDVSFYGVVGGSIIGNEIRDSTLTAIILTQGFAQRALLSLDIVVLDNLILGEGAQVNLLTPGVFGAEVHGNSLGDGAHITFASGTVGNVVSSTTWLDGTPLFTENILTVPLPESVPVNTVVDAGSDRVMDAAGAVCMADARITVAPPWLNDGFHWEMGDGTVIEDDPAPCHSYADPGVEHTPRLVAFVSDALGEARVLEDSVRVLPAS